MMLLLRKFIGLSVKDKNFVIRKMNSDRPPDKSLITSFAYIYLFNTVLQLR